MGVIRSTTRAHEVGERMGEGGVPPYTWADWQVVYPGSPQACHAAYRRAYKQGWRQKWHHVPEEGE